MTVAQVLPIVTLYASIFCPDKQPLGSNAGKDYLQRTGLDSWELKCCPQGWIYVHRRCSCIPISAMTGFGYHPGVGMQGMRRSSFSKGPRDMYLSPDVHSHVDMKATSGADLHHTINYNTYQLVNFMKGSHIKQNSNQRNAFLLRQHRLRYQNNLRQKQMQQRHKPNSDIPLKGKHIVHIRHSQKSKNKNLQKSKLHRSKNNFQLGNSQPFGKRNLDAATTGQVQTNVAHHQSGLGNSDFGTNNRLGMENTLHSRQGTNRGGFQNNFENSFDGTQWLPGNPQGGSGSVHNHLGNDGTNTISGNNFMNPLTGTGFGASGFSSASDNGNLQNNVVAANNGNIGNGQALSTNIGIGGNSSPNNIGIQNDIINNANNVDPLNANGISNGGSGFAGNIKTGFSNGGSFDLNNGGNMNGPFPSITDVERQPSLKDGGTLSGNIGMVQGGAFNEPLATVGDPSAGNSLNIQSQLLGTDPNLSNVGSISSDSLLGGSDPNVVSNNMNVDAFPSSMGGDPGLFLESQNPGLNPGTNTFDQSSVFNLDGSITNNDLSSQNSAVFTGNDAGFDMTLLSGAEEFSSLMRNGGGPVNGDIGRNSFSNGNKWDATNSIQPFLANSNGGLSSELQNGQTSGTTKSLIDQLLALNMANSLLESGPNVGNVLGNNGNGGSMGLNENQILAGTVTNNIGVNAFDQNIPTDPTMMNNAMLLDDRSILESPVNPPRRLVTETIVLNTHDPLITGHTATRKVSVDIAGSDTSIGGILNAGLLTGDTRSKGIAVDGMFGDIGLDNSIGALEKGTSSGRTKDLTDIDVVNRGIVGIGVPSGRSKIREGLNDLPGGSGAFRMRTLPKTAVVSGGSTNVLFDGSVKKSPNPPARPFDTSNKLDSQFGMAEQLIGLLDKTKPQTSIITKVPHSQSEFGIGNFQRLPQVVPRITKEQSAIETSINEILTISAAETAISKAAKDSMSQKETPSVPTEPTGGRFVSQTGLEISAFHADTDRTLTKDVCLGCTMDGGLGYIRHPTRCDQFVVCYPDQSGTFKPRVQDCPYGQFWSNIDVTCKPSKDVNCENDHCKKLADKYQFSHSTNCVAYWQCQAGHSVIRCCPDGRTFVQGEGCVYSSVCADRCPVTSPSQFMWQVNCNKRPVNNDVTIYEKHVTTGWVSEKCGIGQIYKGEICDCIPADMGNPTYSFKVCKPEVFLPFDTDFKDYSGSNTYVRTENVTLSNGAACFDGTSVISMPKFANMDFGKTVFMRIRYKQMDLKIGTEALLYNGDCEEVPTLVVGTKPSGNSFSVKTNTGAFETSWVPSSVNPADWRDVTVTISDGRLEGQSGINTRDMDVSGGIARSHCGIKLGWGRKFKSFVGCIDEVSIYRCIPNTRMAPDGTLQTAITRR